MKKKILFIVSSEGYLSNGRETRFWFDEVISPFYRFIDSGYEVVIASPKGGVAPIDTDSLLPAETNEDTRRYVNDSHLQYCIANTAVLSEISAEDFDALYYQGGYGPLLDVTNNKDSIKLIRTFYNNLKPVAAVCHGSGVFTGIKEENGEAWIKGKKITSFADSEEQEIKMELVTPFLVEKELSNLGAIYSKSGNWKEYVVQDSILITGQNPASANLVAKSIILHLERNNSQN